MISASAVAKLLTATSTINTSGDNEVIAAVTGYFICVYRYKLRTASTTAVTVTAKNDAGGTVVDTDILQAPVSGIFGSNESVPAPAFLFNTLRGKPLNLNLSGNISVTYSISYFLAENL